MARQRKRRCGCGKSEVLAAAVEIVLISLAVSLLTAGLLFLGRMGYM